VVIGACVTTGDALLAEIGREKGEIREPRKRHREFWFLESCPVVLLPWTVGRK